ncbi:hybrid sensor histidine kinase/response regulator [Coralloluteibacterium stylophorae]|uniref:histidine kinase n=1 Tax=Coralloluteibacterium stylophorae TaxID=1776034 RepID=A0A8J8AXK8_9GAMM|nr:hybrid sensor histidine kinase/response regulator [Coralloluteibacterium stylophorae]MBS7457085.1 hybrid sensor histidine kinase/response regulator [Coralloluteibacterium stylophorae]
MITDWTLLLVSALYVGVLFGVAWWGDRTEARPSPAWMRPLVYSLAMAVYCSSWTFYGAVGTAARTGLGFLPIYLGPLLLLIFGWRILERLALIAREQNIVSIADFIASRYGRAPALAALVAMIAVVAAIPYVALQFKAVATSLEVLTAAATGEGAPRPVLSDPAFYVAGLLAVFAILFGTRQLDATEHHHGMVLAVALESLVKLVAFVAVGVFAIAHLPGGEGLTQRLLEAGRRMVVPGIPQGFVAQTLLAFVALVCLPRQFQLAVVECEDVANVRRARWLFGSYLVLVCVMVLPISAAGQALLAGRAQPDIYVLALPIAQDSIALALAAYIGGFSAATGMVIVASVALATMVSNDLVMPMLLRNARGNALPLATRVLWVRRIAIVVIAALSYLYYRFAGGTETLAAYGLLAFAAVAQFAPALIGGLYWRGGSRVGALAGLVAGIGVWAYTLMLPTLLRALGVDDAWLIDGPLGLRWLRPESLFGLQGWDAITHGTFWSLLANIGTFLVLSTRYSPRFEDRLAATPFLDPYAHRPALAGGVWRGGLSVGDLQALAAHVVGERNARRAFADHFAAKGARTVPQGTAADRALVQFTERLLAASIGAASARLTLTTALRGSGMEIGEVMALLDEASQELRFNREILSATMENMSQAVSVVDRDMRLVAWNRRYQELFDYPDGMLYVGRPVADLIRYNGERGELGAGDVQEQIDKRIAYMRAGTPHLFERVRPDGRTIEMQGRPLPHGGYVTTYNDVTDYKRVERALREANENLEQRVALRTREAEAATTSKTRFLAALSHDVLQPLNAARLFASALRVTDDVAEQRRLGERVDVSLRAAEELLDGLLDISRLEAGALETEVGDFRLDELLGGIAEQYAPLAAERGLSLRVRRRDVTVTSDRRLLRRALQNFVSNALRYTEHGGIVVGVRLRSGAALIEVWDTGPGIPEQHLRHVFEEFRRFDQASPWGERGLGLGLSICQRVSHLLGHPIAVRSRTGRGSVFSMRVPLALKPVVARPPRQTPAVRGDLGDMRVLCLDNDRAILAGMVALLTRWGVEVHAAETVDAAVEAASARMPDALLVDYHLHDDIDGLAAVDRLRAICGDQVPAALVTADGSDPVKRAARSRGCALLTKPLKPASLRAFLAAQRKVVV